MKCVNTTQVTLWQQATVHSSYINFMLCDFILGKGCCHSVNFFKVIFLDLQYMNEQHICIKFCSRPKRITVETYIMVYDNSVTIL